MNRCYLLSVLQALASSSEFASACRAHQSGCRFYDAGCSACMLAETALDLSAGRRRSERSVDALAEHLFRESRVLLRGRQEDAHECLLVLTDADAGMAGELGSVLEYREHVTVRGSCRRGLCWRRNTAIRDITRYQFRR